MLIKKKKKFNWSRKGKRLTGKLVGQSNVCIRAMDFDLKIGLDFNNNKNINTKV